jgi:hypothetical protein
MRRLLGLAAILEAATGLALMTYPPLVTRLLLGDDVSGAGEALGRVAGFALFGWGWPAGRVSSLPALTLRLFERCSRTTCWRHSTSLTSGSVAD